RTLREVEYRIEVPSGLQGLNREYGQVLRHVVAEHRAEDANVEAAAVADAQHRVLRDLVGDAHARRQVVERAFDVEIKAHARTAPDQHLTGIGVDEAALTRTSHGLRTIDFPAQAVVDRQFPRGLPLILSVEEPSVLLFLRIGDTADIALEHAYVTEQEGRQRR